MTSRIFYDAIGLVYAMSIFLFFVDAIHPRRIVNRTALLLLFLVFVAETLLLFSKLYVLGQIPMYSRLDTLLLVSWLILLIALVVDTFFRIDLVMFFANVVSFAFVLFDVFGRQGQMVYAKSQEDLLVLHISFAIISYVAFAFSFVFSIMYLLAEKFLRERRWNRWYFRLPSLEQLDSYAYRSVMIGFPLLLIAMVLGTIWGELVLHRIILFDPKLIATVGLWIMYGVYLLLRVRSGWAGKSLVWYNILCFFSLLLNYVVIGNFSLFHHDISG